LERKIYNGKKSEICPKNYILEYINTPRNMQSLYPAMFNHKYKSNGALMMMMMMIEYYGPQLQDTIM
jgi:hypothetical protein